MAKQRPLDRYVEAGKEFTEASRRCLEAVAHDIIKESETGREHAEDWAEEIVERGRRAAEHLGGLVRKEVRHQVKQLNLATNQDVIKVVQQFVERTTKAAAPVVDAAMKRAAKPAKAPSTKKASTAKATAKKATAKKAAAPRKATPNKAAPAKSAAKKATSAKVAGQKKAAPKKAAATKKAQPRAT